MNAIWMTSMILQWLVIALLAVVVLRLLRAHGERVTPDDPRRVVAGTEVAARDLPQSWPAGAMLGGSRSRPQLVVFYSLTCGPCRATQEALESVHGDLDVDLLVVIADQHDAAADYARSGVLGDAAVVALEDFPEELFPGDTPAAVVIGTDGRIARVGRPQSAAELYELAETERAVV